VPENGRGAADTSLAPRQKEGLNGFPGHANSGPRLNDDVETTL
jgi:hypothetical protein